MFSEACHRICRFWGLLRGTLAQVYTWHFLWLVQIYTSLAASAQPGCVGEGSSYAPRPSSSSTEHSSKATNGQHTLRSAFPCHLPVSFSQWNNLWGMQVVWGRFSGSYHLGMSIIHQSDTDSNLCWFWGHRLYLDHSHSLAACRPLW